MAPLQRTVALTSQLRVRGAEVELLTHAGGREIRDEHLPAMQAPLTGADARRPSS
jgi:hypothetical protein